MDAWKNHENAQILHENPQKYLKFTNWSQLLGAAYNITKAGILLIFDKNFMLHCQIEIWWCT